jgi:SAM-dependent methyltransferase
MNESIQLTPAGVDNQACCDSNCCGGQTSTASVATTPEAQRAAVREYYAEVVNQRSSAASCGCGPETINGQLAYGQLAGYVPEADYGLGCGVPTEVAGIRAGDTVLDLGSGAGNDAFVARAIVGEQGRVIGVDMTPDMIARARQNVASLGYSNVEFRLGEIEALPVERDTVDVVISNCVLNLVPDKAAAFVEIYRVLRPGGHFSISDIVATAVLPDSVRNAAALYAGCIGGALVLADYLAIIERAGFRNVKVVKQHTVGVPDEVQALLAADADARRFVDRGGALLSVTVWGEK